MVKIFRKNKPIIHFLIVIYSIVFQQPYLFANTEKTNLLDDSVLFSSDFFEHDSIIELTLIFDVKEFKDQKSDTNYLPAKLIYFINDSIEVSESVKIKARGEFRKRNCFFPPYWLNIKNSKSVDSFFEDVNKIKVVTHCKNTRENTNFLFKEYIAYKIYNFITEYSFKVRLVRITYIDIGRNNKTFSNWALLIEPEEVLSERLQAYPLKLDKMKRTQMDSISTTIMSVFQYMIGNTDYSILGRHNIKLITHKDFQRPEIIPIPYDLDFSGLVNTYYASPAEGVDIESVTERYYYDICRSYELYNEVLNIFRDKKDMIFDFINSRGFLDKKTKKYLISYLKEFYRDIEKPEFIKKHIGSTCVKVSNNL